MKIEDIIYEQYLNTSPSDFKSFKLKNKSYEAYDKINNMLSISQKQAFNKYIDLYCEYLGEHLYEIIKYVLNFVRSVFNET